MRGKKMKWFRTKENLSKIIKDKIINFLRFLRDFLKFCKILCALHSEKKYCIAHLKEFFDIIYELFDYEYQEKVT